MFSRYDNEENGRLVLRRPEASDAEVIGLALPDEIVGNATYRGAIDETIGKWTKRLGVS
jgi:hypothetical protein